MCRLRAEVNEQLILTITKGANWSPFSKIQRFVSKRTFLWCFFGGRGRGLICIVSSVVKSLIYFLAICFPYWSCSFCMLMVRCIQCFSWVYSFGAAVKDAKKWPWKYFRFKFLFLFWDDCDIIFPDSLSAVWSVLLIFVCVFVFVFVYECECERVSVYFCIRAEHCWHTDAESRGQLWTSDRP